MRYECGLLVDQVGQFVVTVVRQYPSARFAVTTWTAEQYYRNESGRGGEWMTSFVCDEEATAMEQAALELRRVHRRQWLAVQMQSVVRRAGEINRLIYAGEIDEAAQLYYVLWNAIDRCQAPEPMWRVLSDVVIDSGIETLAFQIGE